MWHSNGKVFPYKNQHHYDSAQPKEPRLASTATLGSLSLFRRRAQPRDPDAAMASLRGAHAEAASRRALPHAMQHSLPAGGLRLYRAGVNPAGSRCKGSTHRFLLARAYPGAI